MHVNSQQGFGARIVSGAGQAVQSLGSGSAYALRSAYGAEQNSLNIYKVSWVLILVMSFAISVLAMSLFANFTSENNGRIHAIAALGASVFVLTVLGSIAYYLIESEQPAGASPDMVPFNAPSMVSLMGPSVGDSAPMPASPGTVASPVAHSVAA